MGPAATLVGIVGVIVRGRYRISGESMVPTIVPGDRVVAVPVPRVLPRRWLVGRIVVARTGWSSDGVAIKRLVAADGQAWGRLASGPGVVLVGDERTLSTDSRHLGRVDSHRVIAVVVHRYSESA